MISLLKETKKNHEDRIFTIRDIHLNKNKALWFTLPFSTSGTNSRNSVGFLYVPHLEIAQLVQIL